MLGKQAAVPAAVAGRRRLIERFQDALFSGAGVFTALCSRARIIVKGRDSIPGKSPQPLANPRRSGLHLEGDLLTVHSAGSQKNHSSPFGPYAVRSWNFASNAKASLSPQSKGGSPEQVGSYHLLLALLRYHLQENTRVISK